MNDIALAETGALQPVEPDKQATPEEVDTRVERVWEWLCQPMPRHRVVAKAIKEWKVARRTARWYLMRARRRFVPEMSEADAETMRCEAIVQCERNLADLAVQSAKVKKIIDDAKHGKRDWMFAQLTRISTEAARWLKLKTELEGVLTPATPILIAGQGIGEALEVVREARARVLEATTQPVDFTFELQPPPKKKGRGRRNGSGR